MRYARADRLIQLALEMQAARGGLTLTDIEQRFEVSRRTAIRMRDAVITAFPQADEVPSNDRSKRWRLGNQAARPLLGITADDLASLENAAAILVRENLLEQADELRGVASKISNIGLVRIAGSMTMMSKCWRGMRKGCARRWPRWAILISTSNNPSKSRFRMAARKA